MPIACSEGNSHRARHAWCHSVKKRHTVGGRPYNCLLWQGPTSLSLQRAVIAAFGATFAGLDPRCNHTLAVIRALICTLVGGYDQRVIKIPQTDLCAGRPPGLDRRGSSSASAHAREFPIWADFIGRRRRRDPPRSVMPVHIPAAMHGHRI